MSNLYIVATPIGNLGDITFRAIETLKSVDFVLSEDTRVTKKLLQHYDINVKTISFHEHSLEKDFQKVFELLKGDKNLALVSDAGTPSIADPGSRLINFLREKEMSDEISNLNIIPLPGASSLTTAISVAGLHGTEFYFAGFIPKKKGKMTFLKSIPHLVDQFGAIIFFESGHRILKTFQKMEEIYAENDFQPKIILAKELTKIYEKIIVGNPEKIIEFLTKKEHQKGEFVVIIEK